MMRNTIIVSITVLLCTVQFSQAIIIRVPQDYPTIQQGIDAASAGDIVLVAPGTYNEEIDLKANVTVMGAGADQCVIDGGGNSGDVVFASGNDITNETIFTGFYVTGAISGGSMPGGGGIFCNSGAKPDISGNFVEGNDFGIVTWNQSTAYIHNNVVVNNNYGGITLNTGATVINNTISNCRIGINDGGGYGPTVMNNIITDNSLYGIHAVGTQPVLTYNDVWNNATNYHNCTPGTGSISQDPLYVNPPNDYHLQSGSPCIDSGNPATQYNDPDGSRNDMGAYGGPGAPADFPVVLLTIPQQNEQNVSQSTEVAAMFNMDMDASTFSCSSVVVISALTGWSPYTVVYDSITRIAALSPTPVFKQGDFISVTLSTDIQSMSGDSLGGFNWSFSTSIDSGSGIFSAPQSYGTATPPYKIAAGDFAENGNIDLAVTNPSDHTIAVLLNSGVGYGTATTYSVGNGPTGMCTHDFNRDGHQDIATANSGSNDISIMLGTGAGSFSLIGNYSASTTPMGICAGDFNRDGAVDIAVTNMNAGNVSVLTGNGDGTFNSPDNYPTASAPYDIVTADFDSDGDLDLAVANSSSNNISILLGDGSGNFSSAINYTVGSDPRALCVCDLNADGNMDLIVANYASNNVSRLLGVGNGTFGSVSNYNVDSGPSSIYTADLNADGNGDVVTCNTGSNTISVLCGTGTGSFDPASSFATGVGPSGLCAADFDIDNDIDVATADAGTDSLTVLYNEAALQVASTIPAQYELDVSVNTNIIGTFNIEVDTVSLNDSTFMVYGSQSGFHQGTITYTPGSRTATLDPDLNFYSGEKVTALFTKELHSLIGPYLNGYSWQFTSEVPTVSDGTFADPQNFTVGTQPRGMWAADFDLDSDIDIAATSNPNRVAVLLNNGNGTFGSPTYTTVQGDPIALYGADVDNDNDIDLVSAHNEPGSSHLVILKNNGSGAFTVHATYAPAILGQNVYGGDIDADGDIDVIMSDGWGAGDNVRVMVNNGTGSFSGPVTYTAGTWARGVILADVENDGDLDCAVTNSGNDNVSILYNNGDGDFTQLSNFAIGNNPTAIYANDLNGDGYVDLAAANYSGNNISVIINNGNGTFGNQAGYATGSNTRAIHGADFDGDGDIDLCGSNNGANTVAVLLNNGNGTFQSAATYTVGNNPWSIQAADYDLDGDIDIACNNYNSSNVTILYNTGGGYVKEHDAESIEPFLMVYPNPATDCITFRFNIPADEKKAALKIFDVSGRLVRNYQLSSAPDQALIVIWDRLDNNARTVANGVYFCQLESETITLTREIILIR